MTFNIVSSIQSQVNGDTYVTPTDFSFVDITNDISANNSAGAYQNWWYGVTYYGNNSIAMSKTGQYIMVAGGAGATTNDLSFSYISTSKDYGVTWTKTSFTYRDQGPPPSKPGYVPIGGVAISQDGAYMYTVSTRDGNVRKSTDGGVSWSSLYLINALYSDVACSSNGKYVFCSGTARYDGSPNCYSTNYGVSYTNLASIKLYSCVVVSNDGKTVFAALPKTSPPSADYFSPSTLYKITNIQTNDVVNPSPTYNAITSAQDITGIVSSLCMSYNGKILMVGTTNSGDIYISNDYGSTFTKRTLNGSGNCYCSMSYSGKQMLVNFGASDSSSNIFYSTNGTASSVSDIVFTKITSLQNFTTITGAQWSGSAISGDGSRAIMVAGSSTKYVNSANIRLAYMSDNK